MRTEQTVWLSAALGLFVFACGPSASGDNDPDPGANADDGSNVGGADFVFRVPYKEAPDPAEDDLGFSTALQLVDLYVLIDRSGSMVDEMNSIRSNLSSVIQKLTCGTGAAGQCIKELWSGLGAFTYADYEPFIHKVDMQPNAEAVGNSMPAVVGSGCPAGGCVEPHLLAAFSAASGKGPSATGCFGVSSYPDRMTCAGSPAGDGGKGYPCFRPNALPVILLVTDEPPSTQFSCPGFSTVGQAASAIGAKIVGVRGASIDSTEAQAVQNDLATLATSTGAVNKDGQPLVFQGFDGQAASAIENGIRTLTNSIPLDMSARIVDDPSDEVDTVAAFVDRVETLQAGSPECTGGLAEQDSNGDGRPDVFVDVVAGTPICWKLVPRQNTTVANAGTEEPKLYPAKVEVYGDGVTLLDTRTVLFVVPPSLPDVE